jgi:Domain of unknown function (DUF5615)
LRLLLDEMYPHAIADRLRASGREIEAVTRRADLRALPDSDIFATAQRERRAIVTENISDFSQIADDHDHRGIVHHGLVLVDPGKYPRGAPGTIGRMVTELDRVLAEHPSEEPTSLRCWL